MVGASTTGRHDPYWYESFVGLIEVVNLLDPNSETHRVAFQVEGLNGWDDVVVTLKTGMRRCYQVKHTRAGDSLTFGDLVQPDGDAHNLRSLLGHLFNCWRDAGLNDGQTECILYTNREAGNRWSQTAAGVRRPPLLQFAGWLGEALKTALKWEDIEASDNFAEAWAEWSAQLAPGEDAERFDFLKALSIKSKQDDLDGLEKQLRSRLASALGVAEARISVVFDALCRALKKWTTGHPGVGAEELFTELAITPDPTELSAPPPPPAPFFRSRQPLASEIEEVFKSDSTEPVVFLTGEPGSGKTSVVSYLENRRDTKPFDGLVGVRFFCFEPIRPEAPVVAPDASRVTPVELWFSLLTQLREGLVGRLHEMGVPVRNSLLSWSEARSHVLRLADAIGKEHGKRFVIVIDGIDHAARAAQAMPDQIADFFRSLPGPDELESLAVRLLVVGQPPEHYRDQYPTWLLGPHAKVRVVDLPSLDRNDIRSLCRESDRQLALEHTDEVVRIVETCVKGNTLATVFAIAECGSCTSPDDLQSRLEARQLADGVDSYYTSIWTHMLTTAGGVAQNVDACLAGTISMARRSVSGHQLATAFDNWGQPAAWWDTLLVSLGPLLTVTGDGARVRHNDVRVFLARRFAAFPSETQRNVASRLANWLRTSDDRESAHLQLFAQLRLADRMNEAASVFDVNWVLEAASVDVASERLVEEARAAVSSLAVVKDWSLVVSVTCAIQTLDRIMSAREHEYYDVAASRVLPPFLPSEARPRPLSRWTLGDIKGLVVDCTELVDFGECDRARDLLRRWLDGLTLAKLIVEVPTRGNDDRDFPIHEIHHEQARQHVLESLGRLCGLLDWRLPLGDCRSNAGVEARVAFENGFVQSIDAKADTTPLRRLFFLYKPRYLSAWQATVRRLVELRRWEVVREALTALENSYDGLDSMFRAEATWWAVQSGAVEDSDAWLSVLASPDFGLGSTTSHDHEDDTRRVKVLLNVSRALGWKRSDLDPGDIGETVFAAYGSADSKFKDPMVLMFWAAALIGKLRFFETQHGLDGAGRCVSPRTIRQMLSTLWCLAERHTLRFRHWGRGVDMADELSQVCARLGADHAKAAADIAVSQARSFPIDCRMDGLWDAVVAAGQPDLLRQWLRHWLEEGGKVWHLPAGEIHSAVKALVQRAPDIGERELAEQAQDRLKWRSFSYLDRKEYGFKHVYNWFQSTAIRQPEAWRTLGWQLWCICEECDRQGGDNRYESGIFDCISSAAMRCGVKDWWQLASSTLGRTDETGWHDFMRARIVNGGQRAIWGNWSITDDDLLTFWCMAVAFSFWAEPHDNGELAALQEAIFGSRESEDTGAALLASLQAVTHRHFADNGLDDQEGTSEQQPESDIPLNLNALLRRIENGEFIGLSEACGVIRARSVSPSDRATILQAIGCCSNYTSDWGYLESPDVEALTRVVASVSDGELWYLIESLDRDISFASSWTNGICEHLLELAHARARSRPVDELCNGLQIQLNTHARWAFGTVKDQSIVWPALPEAEESITWRDVAIRFVVLLIESYSSEVIAAALEGMHALVAHDHSVIVDFFRRCKSPWARRWLLNASESWAALYPAAFTDVKKEVEAVLNDGVFEEKLQAWIVLCQYSDLNATERPQFPIPAKASDSKAQPLDSGGLLRTPAKSLGREQLSNRQRSATRKLGFLEACGFDFSTLESEISNRLHQIPRVDRVGPHRRNSFNCTQLDSELAVGGAIESVLSAEWCSQEQIPLMAQALLSNEDAWLQREPPRPADSNVKWPCSDFGYGDIQPLEVEAALFDIGACQSIPEGWTMFSAFVLDSTWKEDFSLFIWYEQQVDQILIRPPSPPSTLSARTFVWWLGNFCENQTQDDRFVSGFRAGGMLRLPFCARAIQPSEAWRSVLGWSPDRRDPMTWQYGGEPIARYQRRHGKLHDDSQSPSIRQPVLERWIVTQAAFRQAEAAFGPLRVRDNFEVTTFKN